MSTEENKAIVRRLYEEVVDQGDLRLADALVSADYVAYFPGSASPMDREGLKQFIAVFRAAFPDARHMVEDLIAEGDRVVVRVTARGTHRGSFQGMPPTGKQIALSVISIYRLQGGKIVEEHSEGDLLGLMKQLGAIPASP